MDESEGNIFINKLLLKISKIETEDDLNIHAETFHSMCPKKSSGIYVTKKTKGTNSQKKKLNVNDKNAIRALFDKQNHRALQEILFGETIYCHISTNKIEEYFFYFFNKKVPYDLTVLPSIIWNSKYPTKKVDYKLCKDFTSKEVRDKLRRKMNDPFTKSRSAGIDNVKYKDLYAADNNCSVITALFNTCLKLKTMPKIWMNSYSVLIKKNDEDCTKIENWQLITLNNTITKLFQALIAARLIKWAKQSHRLSATQKASLMENAACESSFLLQECKLNAQRYAKDLAVAWLDFKNAENFIPQDCVLEIMLKHSIPDTIRIIIEKLLKNSNIKIRVSGDENYTNSIEVKNGLIQGSPMTPILLDLVMEPILRQLIAEKNKVNIFHQKINHFVIRNELTLISESSKGLQEMLNSVAEISKNIGLRFNISGSKSYHFNGKTNKIEQTKFYYSEQLLDILPESNVTDYFGVRQGLSIGQEGIPTINEMFDSICKIDASHLDEIQKVTSLLVFILPRVENYLRGSQIDNKEEIKVMDLMLKEKLKLWLKLLPESTPESIVYHISTFKDNPNLHYLPFIDLFYIMKISHGLKMLTSPDYIVKSIAYGSLRNEVSELLPTSIKANNLTDVQLARFLSGKLHIKNLKSKGMWVIIREGTLHLKMMINISWECIHEMVIGLSSNNKKFYLNGSNQCEHKLKTALIQYYVNNIKNKNSGANIDPKLKK